MRSTLIIQICSSSLCTCLHHMVILRTRNKITDFLMILAWASPFKKKLLLIQLECDSILEVVYINKTTNNTYLNFLIKSTLILLACMYCTMAFKIHFHIRLIMFPILFVFMMMNQFFSENGPRVLRDLVDALKT